MDPWSPMDLVAGGIGAVLSVNTGDGVCVADLSGVGIDYCCVPLSAAAPPRQGDLEFCVDALPRALSFVIRSIMSGRGVVVHCHAGKDRTGLLLAYFLCVTEGLSPIDAIREVRRVRPIAFSAYGWETHGYDVLTALQKSNAESLKQPQVEHQ